VDNGLLLVGDAAAQVSPILGEGIRFALDIGRMAGTVAAEAVARDDVTAKFLSTYERLWRRKYQRTFQIGFVINQRLAQYTDEQWDEKIKMLSRLDPALVPEILKCEFSPALFLRILFQSPGLVSRETWKRIGRILSAKAEKSPPNGKEERLPSSEETG